MAIVLPSTTTEFLQRIRDDLSIGSDLGSSVRGAAQNYLRAQDMATALELLQDGLQTGSMTATGGTTSTVVDGASTFTASRQIGNVVTFDGNVTGSLAGVTAVVLANTDTTLTFEADSLPDAPQAGDTYSIAGGFLDAIISDLRGGRGLADAPASNVYGHSRHIQDALLQLVERFRESASSTLTLATDGPDTIDVDSNTTSNDFSILFVDPNDTNQALSSSFDAVSGILTVSLATDGGGALLDASNTTTLVAAEIDASGFSTSDTGTDSITATELGRFFFSGGSNGVLDAFRVVQTGTIGGVATVPGVDEDDTFFSRITLDNRGVPFLIDQLKGRIFISGVTPGGNRRIVSNDGDSCLVGRSLDADPGAIAYVLAEPIAATEPHPSAGAHPGAQPGANAVLADFLRLAQESIEASTVPS